MSPSWLARLSPTSRDLLVQIARRTAFGNQADLLAASLSGSVPSDGASRQARHAQLTRARSTVAAGALALAAHEPDVMSFVLSREFVWLRGFTMDMQFKWPLLKFALDATACMRMFEAGTALFFDLTSRLHTLDQADLLRVHSAVLCMYPAALMHPRKVVEAWTDNWDEAEHRDLLRFPQVRIRLGALGGWIGTDEAQLEGVFDSGLQDAGLCDAYCFVRTDTRADVYENTAALIRGDRVDPRACLLPMRPSTTLRAAIDYVRASFRDSEHLRTPGQVVYLLMGLWYIENHARQLRAEGVIKHELDDLLDRLRGFGELQVMEKKRFWRLCDRLPEGSNSRRRLLELWGHEFGASL